MNTLNLIRKQIEKLLHCTTLRLLTLHTVVLHMIHVVSKAKSLTGLSAIAVALTPSDVYGSTTSSWTHVPWLCSIPGL